MMNLCLTLMFVYFKLIIWNTTFNYTMFKIILCITLSPSLYPAIVELVIMHTSKPFAHTTLPYISFFLAVFHSGIHYIVMSLAHLATLSLQHVYISLYTGYAFMLAVVSIALEHKLLEKKEMAPLLHSL